MKRKEDSMSRRVSVALALLAGVVVALSLATVAEGRQKAGKDTTAKQARLDGTVHMIDKATKTITVRLRSEPGQRQVVYSDDTKFTFRNKPASLDDVKDGRRVICLGKYNENTQLVATRIDVRDRRE
jgi:hypothetical protein